MNKQIPLLIIAAVVLVALGLALGRFFDQPVQLTSTATPTPAMSTSPTDSMAPTTVATAVPTATPLSSPIATPVVIFKSESTIPATDKAQLQSRVIEPFIQYHAETRPEASLISLSISPTTNSTSYTVNYVFSDKVNGGFLIEKTDGQIAWWLPECLGVCPFSDSFKAKYPEIVKQF